jgi:ribokinase
MKREIVVVGSLNLDMVAFVPRTPQIGETIFGSDFKRFTGGKGANQAVAAAQLGAAVHMIGRHGTDGFEAALLETLRAKGVDTSGMTPAEGPSGIAVIMVTDEGNNCIVVIPGANGKVSAQDIQRSRERIANAAVVLTQLETPMESVEETLAVAADASVPVILDPAPVCKLSPELLHKTAWLTPNETEAAFLGGAPVPEGDAIRRYAEEFLALGPQNILLKLGARGAYLATQSGLREHIPGHVVAAVDSTAAGDALNGALASALVRGADPVEAARFSVAAAAISVTRHGAIPSLATLAEVEEFRAQVSRTVFS